MGASRLSDGPHEYEPSEPRLSEADDALWPEETDPLCICGEPWDNEAWHHEEAAL